MKDPDDAAFAAWGKQLHDLYQRAQHWASQPGTKSPADRQAVQWAFEQEALVLCHDPPPQTRQSVLANRIMRYLPELFRFVGDSGVPATNNAAERALRPLVVARKISGGTRSDQGTTTRMVLQSLIDSWTLRNEDPVANMLTLLRRQPAPYSKLAGV